MVEPGSRRRDFGRASAGNLLFRLLRPARERTAQILSAPLAIAVLPQNPEGYRVPRLKRALNAPHVVHRVYGLVIDREQDVLRLEANIFRKRILFDGADLDAARLFDPEVLP